MFAQVAAAFDGCRDAVTAALDQNQRAFQEEVGKLLKRKDEEIEDLKGQLQAMACLIKDMKEDFSLEIKTLKAKVQIEADLTSAEVRGFRCDLDTVKRKMTKVIREKEEVQTKATTAESDEEALMKIKNLACVLVLIKTTFCLWLYQKTPLFCLCAHPSSHVSKGDTCKTVFAKVMMRFKEEEAKAAAKPEARVLALLEVMCGFAKRPFCSVRFSS